MFDFSIVIEIYFRFCYAKLKILSTYGRLWIMQI